MLSAVMQAAPDKPVSKSSRQLYEKAAQAIASADPSAAITPLEQLIEDQPTSTLACIAAVHLAECFTAINRERDAAALLEKWSDRITTASKSTKLDANLDAHHLRVWLQAAKRISDDTASIEALKVLTQNIESREMPSEKAANEETPLAKILVDSRVELAKRLATTGKLELATEQLAALTDAMSDTSDESKLLVAMIYQQLGVHSQTQKLLQSLIESEPHTPSHSLARLEMAAYALQDRNVETAANLLMPIIDSTALHHGLDENTDCRFRILWSELKLAQGNAAHSLEVLPSDEELAKMDESHQVAVRFCRAEAASQAGKNTIAVKDLQWLSEYAAKATNEPKWAVSIALRQSELLLKTKDYAKLVAAVEHAKKRFSNYERLHEFDYLLARAAMQRVEFEQARIHLQAIIESDSARGTSAVARAEWMLGETLFMEQNPAEAINAYKRVTLLTESQPWQSLALIQTAKCYELLNQSNDALEAYQQAVSVTKDENIRQEAAARIEVIERTATKAKPPTLR